MRFPLTEVCRDLSDLYSITGTDWILNVSHILTEPTCPTVTIHPEEWQIARYRVDADSIEEGVKKAVDLVRLEVIDRRIVGSYAPFTNPDDKAYLEWLQRRAAGSDEHLPHPPSYNEHDRRNR